MSSTAALLVITFISGLPQAFGVFPTMEMCMAIGAQMAADHKPLTESQFRTATMNVEHPSNEAATAEARQWLWRHSNAVVDYACYDGAER